MAKGENVAFEVGVSSIRERLGNQVYSAGRLFASGVLMDEILSQGFDYTPTKVLFRMFLCFYFFWCFDGVGYVYLDGLFLF
jgi:hypothetical protein